MPKGCNPNSIKNLTKGRLTPEQEQRRREKHKITVNSPEYKEKLAKKRSMSEILTKILNSKVSKEQLEKLNVDPENYYTLAQIMGMEEVTLNDAMLMQAVNKGIMDKDITAMAFVRDTIGEKAPEKVETSVSIEDYVKTHKPKL